MQPLSFLAILLAIGVWGFFQARFVDQYMEKRGGPNRRERQRLFLNDPRKYAMQMRAYPQFRWRAMFSPLVDQELEALRRRMLASTVLILLAVAFSIWTTANAPEGLPRWVVVIGGFATSSLWLVILLRSHGQTGWIRAAAVLGIVMGALVGIIAIAYRP